MRRVIALPLQFRSALQMIVRIDEKEPASTAGVRWPRVCSTFSRIPSSQDGPRRREEIEESRKREETYTCVICIYVCIMCDR